MTKEKHITVCHWSSSVGVNLSILQISNDITEQRREKLMNYSTIRGNNVEGVKDNKSD